MLLPTRRLCPRKNIVEHAEAAPCWTFVWRCQTVRRTNQQCLSVPPLLPSTCRVDPVRISSCILGWQNDHTTMWLLLWRYIHTTTCNMCSQQSPPMEKPTPSPVTPVVDRFHQRCRCTCTSLLAYRWVTFEPSLPIPSADEPTWWTSCMFYLIWPVGPTRSANFVGRFCAFLAT